MLDGYPEIAGALVLAGVVELFIRLVLYRLQTRAGSREFTAILGG